MVFPMQRRPGLLLAREAEVVSVTAREPLFVLDAAKTPPLVSIS